MIALQDFPGLFAKMLVAWLSCQITDPGQVCSSALTLIF